MYVKTRILPFVNDYEITQQTNEKKKKKKSTPWYIQQLINTLCSMFNTQYLFDKFSTQYAN